MKFSIRKKSLPKTREELFKELDLPNDDHSNKALSSLMQDGLVEYTEKGYYLNSKGVKVVKQMRARNEN